MEIQGLYLFIKYYYNLVALFYYFRIKYLLHTHQNQLDYLHNYYFKEGSFLISTTSINNFEEIPLDLFLHKDCFNKVGVIHFLLL
jgi:hypothetical protein